MAPALYFYRCNHFCICSCYVLLLKNVQRSPILEHIFAYSGFKLKFKLYATTSLLSNTKLIAQPGSRSAPSDQTNERAHVHESTVCVLQRRSVQAALLSRIKDACRVWVVCLCFLVMPGPSGSSQVNKSMSFDKHASHPHAHVLPGAV